MPDLGKSGKVTEKSCVGEKSLLTFPPTSAIILAHGGLAQLVRAPASHAGGRWFESISLHQSLENAVFSRDFPFSLKKVRPLAFFAIFEESRRSDFL